MRELISAFVPEEILRDFEPKEAKEVVRCGYMNPCEIQTFPIVGREAFIYIRRRRCKDKGG